MLGNVDDILKSEDYKLEFGREAEMRRYLTVLVLAVLIAAICMPGAFAQSSGNVKGECKDLQGAPIVGATVEWTNLDNGRKYTLKTDKHGDYFSLGIDPGKYHIVLTRDGQKLDEVNNYHVGLDETVLDFDLRKSQAETAKAQGMTSEQLKAKQEQVAKAQKENDIVKVLNEHLQAAAQSAQAGDYDTAIKTLDEATQLDPNRDLLWAKLGDSYLNSAGKQTDPAEKSKRYDQATQDYQKAIDLKQKAIDANPTQKTPQASKDLATYYNNLGRAQADQGKTDDAVKTYNQAAQLDPAGAGTYFFNLGAILTNTNVKNDADMRKAAVAAFDKAIAVDPNRADAYYWKGTNLIGMATLQGDKMVAPDGTAEAFQKYLELQPTGPHAEEAKAMLQGLGASIETSYGKKKGTPVKAPPKK